MSTYVPHQRTLDAYYHTIDDDELRAEARRRGIARDIESLLSDADESALWVTASTTGDEHHGLLNLHRAVVLLGTCDCDATIDQRSAYIAAKSVPMLDSVKDIMGYPTGDVRAIYAADYRELALIIRDLRLAMSPNYLLNQRELSPFDGNADEGPLLEARVIIDINRIDPALGI